MKRCRRWPRRAAVLARRIVRLLAMTPDEALPASRVRWIGERWAERLERLAWRQGVPVAQVAEELDRLAEERR